MASISIQGLRRPTSKEKNESLRRFSVPIFDGSDGADAQDFVLAVRQRAYAEGRQHDGAWILDLVSASLSRDALQWHTTLDPAIRKNWNLLEKALLARFYGTFKGIDGVECERFVLSIRRRTFEEGKVGDNEWITQFVASCMADDALRWHLDLAPEIKNDWTLLQKAMVAQYPPPDVRERPLKSTFIPTPASAAPGPREGVVRFVDPSNPGLKTYLSRTSGSASNIIVTQDLSDALTVEFSPGESANTIKIKNFSLRGFDWMGIKWYYAGAPNLSAMSNHYARPAGVSCPPSRPATSSYSGGSGSAHADIWDIAADGSIKISWTNASGGKVSLFPRRHSGGTEIMIAGERCSHDTGYTRGSFVFEAK